MKKVLSLFLVCVMLLTLAACGKDEPKNSEPDPTATNSTETTTNSTEETVETTQASTNASTAAPGQTTTDRNETPDKPTETPNKPTENTPAACSHSWNAATCSKPKTCSKCGATEGSTGAHDWSAATCKAPKTCKNCKVTEGALAAHSWKDASYTAPKTCSVCGATEGKALPVTWTFTDGGDHIIATSQAGTKNIPLDTSHLPQDYEDETTIQTVTAHRSDFRYINGWVAFFESYTGSVIDKINNNNPGLVGTIGTVLVKMDGSKQFILSYALPEFGPTDYVAGYADGYLYYIKIEGIRMMGQTERHQLYKRTFSADGILGQEILVADLTGIDNEFFESSWIEDGWVFYSCFYPFGDGIRSTYKIRLDGTQNQQVTQ